MAMETEVKVLLRPGELESIRTALCKAGGVQASPRSLEENLLFDTGEGSLQRDGCALRLRVYGGRASVTFKGPVQPNREFKKRPEFQVSVSDGDSMRRILESLGLEASFQYDKYREKWAVSNAGWTVEICLDETPVGDFAEIEGEPESIRRMASLLGLEVDRFLLDNYVDLYREAGLGKP